eukprot:TRINITY_DN1920_c0_g1_i1.p1 TRINITY_DN1920_c0_g1~~TRINITY_DN1920_c0_g1_i1.p1  ORF type:complete len:626 (-),score=144.03 TRINITY_DN1920_c0_g1_i1:64-1941(-)
MSGKMDRSFSAPGLMKLGMELPKSGYFGRKSTFSFAAASNLASAVDLHKTPVTQEGKDLAASRKAANWRTATNAPLADPMTEEDFIPKNMRYPKIIPAWLKHDKQVLRFYGFFQEAVVERPDENSRYRHVSIMYYMEDGTISMTEPKVENSGIPQGAFLKRHRVPRDDGLGFIGPDDFRIGQEITFYGRTYHLSGCDRFTRWFYEENGIALGEDESMVTDAWQKSYKLKKTIEKGGMPPTKSAIDAKNLTKFQIGHPPADKKMIQFLLNDRKVLRFKAYWDDVTPYGARIYLIVHYYLGDNTVEINEAHCRNSGRDAYPVFMKRGPLYKQNEVVAVPGILTSDTPPYLPEDMVVGKTIDVWGRQLMLYECDEFTQEFYKKYLEIDQMANRIDVSEKPLRHIKLAPPPHNGVGKPEDSLINTQMIVPKAPKIDLERMMVLTGEVLRFECKMVNGEPEDELRRLVIAYYPADDDVAVFEVPVRNSGHMGGKFADKRRIVNPDTGEYFKLSDLFVGQTVTIASQPLHIIRADEHALQFLEARPDQFPYADPVACARRLLPLADHPEMNDPMGIQPDRLKQLAAEAGVPIVNHEIITLLRNFGVEAASEGGAPAVLGAKVLECAAGRRR